MCLGMKYTLQELKDWGYGYATIEDAEFYVDLKTGNAFRRRTGKPYKFTSADRRNASREVWETYHPDYDEKPKEPRIQPPIFVVTEPDYPNEPHLFLDENEALEFAEESLLSLSAVVRYSPSA